MTTTSLLISSPKRRPATSRSKGYFPYYAGFSESFAADIIRSSEIPKSGVILDPWNGSGTTTHVASTLGYSSIGIDLNPVMVLVGKARSLPLTEVDSIAPCAKALAKSIRSASKTNSESDPLSAWFEISTVRRLRALEQRIRHDLISKEGADLAWHLNKISCFAATFYVALFAICKKFTNVFGSSNPTWLRFPNENEKKISLSAFEIADAFISECLSLATQNQNIDQNFRAGHANIFVGDSTQKMGDQQVDLILTSPPYCTRIDYTAATRVELAVAHPLLENSTDDLSRRMIGSTKVPHTLIAPTEKWGATCLNFLDKLSQHKSKASNGYYFKTHIDYFNKLSKSVENIQKIIKKNGMAVLVVQDSYYKEIHNDVALVMIEMAANSNLRLERRDDFSQSNPISAINSKSRVYRSAINATESVLCFKRD